MSNTIFDLAIVGGGPAGVAAGVYAARKQLKTVFITRDWQSQSAVSEGIENWIGTVKISGQDFAKSLETHIKAYAGDIVTIREGESCSNIVQNPDKSFTVTTTQGSAQATYTAKSVIVATGSTRRKLDIPGAAQFEHKGITYCATCDGPLFDGQDVAVIGGGNAAFESAAQLAAYCKTVTIFNRSGEFRADPVTVEKVLGKANVKAIKNAALIRVEGGAFVERLVYKTPDVPETVFPIGGIFVEIGSLPATDFVASVVERDSFNHIKVDPRNQRASRAGIWAAGDCTDGLYHQNNIAAGDAVKALEDIYMWLHA